MPSINNPATATVKIISADKGIKFYNPQTRQTEKVVSGQEIPANAVLEFSQQGEIELSFDGQILVVQGSPDIEQSIAQSLDLTSPDRPAEGSDSIPAQYQPLPSLLKVSELSKADFKPARTGGFTQPVVERAGISDETTAYDLVIDDIRRPESETTESMFASVQNAVSEASLQPVAPTITSIIPSQPSAPDLVNVKTSKPELSLDNEPVTVLTNVVFAISGKTQAFNKVTLKFKALEKTVNAESDGTFKFEYSIKDEQFLKQINSADFKTKTATCDYQILAEDTAGNITTSDNQILLPFSPTNITIVPDTGYIDDNLVTNSHTVTIHGDSLIGAETHVSVQVGDMDAVVIQPDRETGHWQTSAFNLENDGKYDVNIWYGKTESVNDLTDTTISFEIDTTKPRFDDENFLSKPVYSNANPPELDVKTEAGNCVTAELTDSNGHVISKASGIAASAAHLIFDSRITEGAYSLKVVLTDPVGNEETRKQTWHADFTRPDAPTVELVINDSQFVDGTNYVQDVVRVRVTAEANSITRFEGPGGNALKPVSEPVPDGNGKLYQFNFSEPGSHVIRARCTDLAGNQSNKSEAVQFEVLTTAPAIKKVVVPEEVVFLKADDVAQVKVSFDQQVRLINPDQLKLILQLDEGKKVEAGFAGQFANDNSLTFYYTVVSGDNAAEGVVVPAGALDPAKIVGLSGIELEPVTTETAITTLIIDTVAPDIPEITHLSTNNVDNPSFNTNASEFDLMGRAEAGSKIQLHNADNGEKIGEPVYVLANKDWWLPLTTPTTEVTESNVYVIATDAAGNKSSKSANVTITSDPIRPKIDSIEGAETATKYAIGDDVSVTLKFSKPVVVTGDPELNLKIGNTSVEAKLDKSTVGPDSLTFKYPVTINSPVSGRISVPQSALKLAENDSIRDALNHSVVTEINQSHQLQDSISTDPVVTDINPQEQEGTYTAGDKLSFNVEFNKPVSLSSRNIKLQLQLDGETTQLPLSESTKLENTHFLVFDYVVTAGQNAKNGITVVAFEMNGTTITDSDSQVYSKTVFDKEFSAYSIDTPAALESLNLAEGTDQVLGPDKIINVELRFDEPVKVTGVEGKLPEVVLTIGNQPHTLTLAACESFKTVHSLSYTVAEGDSGSLQLSPLTLNGAGINDEAGLNAVLSSCALADISGHRVDTTPSVPSEPIRVVNVEHIGGPRDYKSGNPSDNSDDKSGDLVKVKVTFSGQVLLEEGVKLKAFAVKDESQVAKFMKCLGSCSDASSEFIFAMRTEDKLVSDNGFIVTRFSKSTKDLNLIRSADDREVDIVLPKQYLFEDATFNSGTVSVESPAQQTTDTTSDVKSEASHTIAVDRKGEVYRAGDTVTVKLVFEKPVIIIQGQNPAMAQLQIGYKLVNASLKTSDGLSSELEFTCAVPAGLSDYDGITLEGINPGDTLITDTSSVDFFDLSTVSPQNLEVNVDSVLPRVVTIVPEQGSQTRYFPGDTLSIDVRLSKPVHTVSSFGSEKPYLELEFESGKPTVKAFLNENASTAQSLIFSYNISDKSPLATEGIRVSSIHLSGANYEDSAGNPLDVTGISSIPLNTWVLSPYPSLVSAENALISDDSILITNDNPTIKVVVPDGVDNIECHFRKMVSTPWRNPAHTLFDVKSPDASTIQFNIFNGAFPKWLFTYKCNIVRDGVEMSQVYKVGNLMPSHHYNFDTPWAKDISSGKVPSMSYSGEQTKAIVDGIQGEDISQVTSPFSAGYALQLNGGALWLDDMSKVFKGSFTVCSQVQTTISGADKPWLSPSLIGKENPGSTNDIFLFTINSSGHTGIALGDRYGAMTSQPVNDGNMRYLCVTRDLTTDTDGTSSTTQVYINGVPDGNPVTIYHKGHSALENDRDARRAPEAELTIELDTIGHTASENSEAPSIPFTGTIDDLEISPFAMGSQQVADAYTQHLHMPVTSKGDYESAGLLAVTSRPQFTSASQVKVTFSQVIKEERTVGESGQEKIQQKEVDDPSVQFECELNDNAETYNLDSVVKLNNPNFDTFRGFRCKPADTDISTYRISFNDQDQSSIPEALLLIGNAKGAGLYFDGIVHNGLSQAGNSPLEPKPTTDYFIAEQSAVLDNVGPEDLIILDTMPEMRDLLGKETSIEVESALNELVHCSHSTVKALSSGGVTDGNASASLTIDTIAPDQPVTAYLAGELYTINPDHIV